MVWIGKPWALECQFLLMAKRVDPLKGELFDVVTCLESGLVEFNHPLDQCLQARCQVNLFSLIINLWWKELFVCALWFIGSINVEQFLDGALPPALESGV
jgi:hypothetical protein